jgi:hypothetical protein
MSGAAIDELSLVRKEGARKLTYRYSWFAGAPLREGKDALVAKRARKRFFEHIRTITAYLVFPDWPTLMVGTALIRAVNPGNS